MVDGWIVSLLAVETRCIASVLFVGWLLMVWKCVSLFSVGCAYIAASAKLQDTLF
jgi:hypothetical protein